MSATVPVNVITRPFTVYDDHEQRLQDRILLLLWDVAVFALRACRFKNSTFDDHVGSLGADRRWQQASGLSSPFETALPAEDLAAALGRS